MKKATDQLPTEKGLKQHVADNGIIIIICLKTVILTFILNQHDAHIVN